MAPLQAILLFLSTIQLAASDCNDIAYGSSPVFVSPAWTKASIDASNVTVIDARGAKGYDSGHLQGAVLATWQSFTMGCPGVQCGVLNTPAYMKDQFAKLGVSPGKAVVVYGAWSGGWGDEGRIYWMLKSLGHKHAYVLSGGLPAYTAKYNPTLSTTATTPIAVDISLWSSGLDVTGYENIAETKSSITQTDLLVDTRTEGEYDGTKTGAANYNVLRDGHAEGAVSFPFSTFFDGQCLKTCSIFKSDLEAKGWKSGRALVSYCTGGIRSAFFFAIARHCGIQEVSNYGGSMWEWAADNTEPMSTNATAVAAAAADAASSSVGMTSELYGSFLLSAAFFFAF